MRRLLLAALALAAAPALRAQEEGEARPGVVRPTGFVVFYDVQGPLSYVAITPKELPDDAKHVGEVHGRSCQYLLSVPLFGTRLSASVAKGWGGYRKALEDIRKARPEVRGLFDVRVDNHNITLLSLFTRVCTDVTARAFE